MVVLSFILFVGLSIRNQLVERNDSALTNAYRLIASIDALEGQEETALKNMEASGIIPDAVLVYDKNGNLLAGHGEPTYSGHESTGADASSENNEGDSSFTKITIEPKSGDTKFYFYFDEDFNLSVLDSKGNINLKTFLTKENLKNLWGILNQKSSEILGTHGNTSVSELFSEETFKNIVDSVNKRTDSSVFNMKFWVGADLTGERRAMVKCHVSIFAEDIEEAVGMGCAVALLLLILVALFFFNLLISFINQHKMSRLIDTDPVTGGKSYVYFENRADKILQKKSTASKQMMIADITIMKYRNYRNFHGIKIAEVLLEDVDKAISETLKRREICAHSGKSSFALLLECADKKAGEERINSLVEELSSKFDKCGIGFHAGIYFYEYDEKNKKQKTGLAAECFSRASAARASITDENKVAVALYDDKLLEEQKWNHKVEEKMQAALDNEEFQVYIQPKYNPSTDELAGGEALIRWINEEDGFISPGRFIPIFENNGFITKIDDYMLSHVAKLQAEWLKEGKKIVPISVNVSRAHFADPELAEHIRSLVDEYDVPHHFIELELTESAFFDDKAALLTTVHRLQDMGFEISMDDFGSGYSSLNSLKDLPLDVLNLDAEFFRGEDGENRMEIVVSQAIKLAKSLDMRIVAEGVEKKEQVDFLARQGCDMIQGFYYAKPMPAEEYALRFKENRCKL